MKAFSEALSDLKELRSPASPRLPFAVAVPPVPAVSASDEQQRIVSCSSRCLRVVALAGTGKTEVLAAYAKRRGRARLRYLAFNRAMATEAAGRLPPNVSVSTFHALAFSRFGASTGHKTSLQWDAGCASSWLGRPVPVSFASSALELVRATVERFVHGFESVLGITHIPPEEWELWSSLDMRGEVFACRHDVVEAAVVLWRAMLDPSSLCPITPDAWVKLAQLGGWQPPGDGWLVDEAQDLSPAMLAWLRFQPGFQVTAGDPHQSIYAFRTPAAWAFEDASDEEERLALTHSFRFGPAVAMEVNRILARMGAQDRVVGIGGPGAVSRDAPRCEATALCRSQAGAWAWGRRAASEGWSVSSMPKPPVRWSSVAALRRGDFQAIEDPWVRAFSSYDEFLAIASTQPRVWSAALAYAERDEPFEHLVGSLPLEILTVHQAKGLTRECVWVGPDLRLPSRPSCLWSPEEAEEARIAYVAASRARTALHIHPGLAARWEDWLDNRVAAAPELWDDGF